MEFLTGVRGHDSLARWILGLGLALGGVLLMAAAGGDGVLDASWTATTTNSDGSPLTNLAFYRLYYGASNPPCPGPSFFHVASPTPSPASTETVTSRLTGLLAGNLYYVSVTAVNTSGNESACSTPVPSAVARTDFTVSPTGTVDFGSVNLGSFVDQTFTVQNTGSGIVSGAVSPSSPFRVVAGTPFTLAGLGAIQAVTVRFTPTTSATATTNVSFAADGDTISRIVAGSAPDPPPPAVSSLAPSSVTAGGVDFTLTVSGSGFVAASVVQWNGAARPTTFVSSTQLQAALAAADIATAGTAQVTVVTPAPGGGSSAALAFTINNPAPTLIALAPGRVPAG